MSHPLSSSLRALLALVALIVPTMAAAQALEPIGYVIRIPEPATPSSFRIACSAINARDHEHVEADYGVFNGAPTFITLAENARRPHDVELNCHRAGPRR